MFEQKTIKYILEKINGEYYLPAIQRDYVWEEKQIINLFDSLLKGFPIGTFLFWKVTDENIQDYDYYEFIKDYNIKEKYNDQKIKLLHKHAIISILDGQQRITSLLIGLQGTYSTNKTRHLYVNLSQMNQAEDIDDIETKYEFKFMTEHELNEQTKWFKVSDIFNMSTGDVTMYAIDHQLSRLGIQIISELHDTIHNKNTINYYLVEENDIDKVLSIFVRINKGGTHLSYSDLLLSIATANWSEMSARDEINALISNISYIDGQFNITKDFVLKTALLLIGENTKFISANLKKEKMLLIEKHWSEITDAISKAFILLSDNHYDNKSLPSIYAAAFIANFFYLYGDPKNEFEKKELLSFVFKSLLKSVYSASLDRVLENGRKYIASLGSAHFNSNDMLKQFTNTEFTQQEIDDFTKIRPTQKTFMLLLHNLYQNKNMYGLTELIPRKRATSYKGAYKQYLNTISTLQLKGIEDKYLTDPIDFNIAEDSDIDFVLNVREKRMKDQLLFLLTGSNNNRVN